MEPALTALREHFGFTAFRPGQAEAVAAALDGRDLLVVMPTGAGKSLCYQLPALLREELTLVVSPLVSLMQDQVEALERAVPGAAAVVNAQQDAAANRAVLARAAAGELRLLYVAPERFSSPGFLAAVRGIDVGLFVVDEAHCVSQWGHDFRPDYFRLGDAARWLGAQAIVASTATATPQVAADIAARLGLRDPVRVTTGFDRPNLSFAVVPCRGPADKRARLAAALAEPDALPAIVYAGTRVETERVAADLTGALGVEVVAYHAGLPREARAEAQRRFMGGDVRVVVATNAFGMGVDKADVRTVAHASVPGSVEAYYQEAGRAGRDGRPARALLLAEARDKGLHVFFIQRAEVDDAAIARVAEHLAAAAGTLPLGEAGGTYDVGIDELGDDAEQVRAIVGHLARAGVIRPAPAPIDRVRGRLEGPFDGRARAACRSSAGEAQRVRWRQYRSVWAFVERDACRRETILRHFGDRAPHEPAVPCCDVCAPDLVPAVPGAVAFGAAAGGDLDAAIAEVVATANPSVGRTRAVEILRGGRSQALRRNAYDGLPLYGAFAHLSGAEVLERVDAMLADGRLRSTGGAYPKLRVTAARAA
ncbi:MAG TPA: RecQ family ATP-dependent DNA helicase [Solirubrobacteraceae bacterium]|nr:RecQ family ATP-dependent DNA helicase [Solirubrobacteraceae bacterium]